MMNMATKIQQKRRGGITLTKLQQEVALLRSVVIGIIGKDEEGEYRPEFVTQILKAAKEPAIYQFKDAKSFLRLLKTEI